jgi:MOSC domain-containing protein YiiM
MPSIDITTSGVTGDHNDWRTANLPGDLKQAVLVVTDDLLNQLRKEGWPVEPGHLGENVTLAGLPESALAPGVRLTLGPVLLEISEACDPCIRLYTLPYVGTGRGPEFLRATVGRRGWYARVLQPGRVATGAAVSLTPRTTRTPAGT